MNSSEHCNENIRRRQAEYKEKLKRRCWEEKKLIEEVRYKRSCIRLAPTFLSEKEIQKRIEDFIRIVIRLTRSNNIGKEYGDLRGSRPDYFARMEAALYKSRIEIMRLEACNTMERIRSAGEGLAMTYDLFRLLVRAKDASEESQEQFYEREEEGVLLDPKFAFNFVRKELDFFDNLKLQMDTEVKEAELQLETENREGAFQQLEDLISKVRRDVSERCMEVKEQLSKQNDVIKYVLEGIGSLGETINDLTKKAIEQPQAIPEVLEMEVDDKENKESLEEIEPEAIEDGEIEENLTDYDVDEDASHKGSRRESIDVSDAYSKRTSNSKNASQTNNHGTSFHKKQIEDRMAELKVLIKDGAAIPERTLCHANFKREQERYMRCAFCLAKGQHYSDCCPIVSTVEARRNRIRCRSCLDTWHSSHRCNRPKRRCNYCHSEDHHTALCIMPERMKDYYHEYDELREELETFEQYDEPSTSGAVEYYEGDRQ
ncbi:hypothetical protein RB195_025335 [Necator americanus]|uniref:Uncharacterized protein n=1 Tax=Necator americanus TaxID=51031 RepID=A0ABR1EU17_NECAM